MRNYLIYWERNEDWTFSLNVIFLLGEKYILMAFVLFLVYKVYYNFSNQPSHENAS